MKVLATKRWTRRTGYLGSALHGQITKLELRGVGICYVRENFQLHSSFNTHSSARLGIGGGVIGGKVRTGINSHRSSLGRNVLELCAPDHLWNIAADSIRAADSLHRPVIKNRSFTVGWAEHQFKS